MSNTPIIDRMRATPEAARTPYEHRLLAEIERLTAIADAANKIRHWHDAPNDGMVVSAEHVRALWVALREEDE